MSEKPKRNIKSKVTHPFGADGPELTIFYLAYEYPTETAAKGAWERAEKKHLHDGFLSIYRMAEPGSRENIVVAVSEREGELRKAQRALAKGGAEFEPTEELLQRIITRRIKLAISEAGPDGTSRQKGRYGRHGLVLGDDGDLSFWKRPQG